MTATVGITNGRLYCSSCRAEVGSLHYRSDDKRGRCALCAPRKIDYPQSIFEKLMELPQVYGDDDP
jgi:hypothetical protein